MFDYSLITDEAIGENILSLSKTIGKLKKEGEIEVPKTWITLTHPEKKDEERGSVKISMQIITQMKADSKPVGDGWDEPNEDP